MNIILIVEYSHFRSKRDFYQDNLEENPNKRQRFSSGSRVVFVRGVPRDCLDSELLALCCPFAVVEKTLMLPQKGQAFVQLPDVDSATNLVEFYKTREPTIRENRLFFEFSNRDEITENNDGGKRDGRGHKKGGNVGVPSTILMVSVTKVQYDMNVEVLQQVFEKFGRVLKVVTFWKDDEFKALVEMDAVENAKAAQSALDGRDIYTGCNTLHIVFSKHTELRVKFNNERSRDFTNPDLPSEERPRGSGMLGEGPRGDPRGDYRPHSPQYRDSGPPPMRDYDYRPPSPRGGYRGPNDYPMQRGDYDGPPRGDFEGPARGYDDYPPDYGRMERGPPPRGYDYNMPPPARFDDRGDYRGRGRDRDREFPDRQAPPVTIIASNLPKELANPRALFTFFGCFGDVVRLKVLFKKQDTALLQFADPRHADGARDMLDGLQLYGRKLRVDYSRHATVSMPRADADIFEKENTKDYTNSPLHRYRAGGRNLRNIVPPCPRLHISGIPPELQGNEEFLRDLFSKFGRVEKISYFEKDRRMAMIDMVSLEEAVSALIDIDNYEIHKSFMRVSFSKSYHRR